MCVKDSPSTSTFFYLLYKNGWDLECNKESHRSNKVAVVDSFLRSMTWLFWNGPWRISFLLSGPWVQLDSSWLFLISKFDLFHLYPCFAMLMIIMAHGYCSYVGLFDCFYPMVACIVILCAIILNVENSRDDSVFTNTLYSSRRPEVGY